MYYIQVFDAYIMQKVIELENPFLTSIMSIITFLGSLGAVWLATGIVFLFFEKSRNTGILIIISVLIGGVVNDLILKNLFSRVRPFETMGISALINEPNTFSFPSGHAFSSFVSAYQINRFNKRMGIFAYILAALIALSRIYLRVHYPTDIIAGAICGMILGACIYRLFHYIKRSVKAKAA